MDAGQGRTFRSGAAGLALAGLAVVGGAVLAAAGIVGGPVSLSEVTWHGAEAFWGVWLPVAAGVLLTWLLGSRTGQGELDRRVRDAMEGHPVRLELALLLGMLLGFAVGTAGLYALFRLVSEELPASAALPVTRLVFLFVLPVLFVDQGGFSLSGHGTRMPRLSMAVREPWRWLGLITVAAVGAPVLVGLHAAEVPTPTATLFVVPAVLVGVSAIEEIFFRGMVQTRLELVAGRPSAVVVTAILYALAHAVGNYYNAYAPLGGEGASGQVSVALVTYGVQGLLLGYVWIRYRNMWVNILLHGVPLLLVLLPSLSAGGVG